jgi:hypothetical protein
MKASELVPDDKNGNKGTQRGRQMVKQSLAEYGAGRSILIDRDNRIVAGNKTVEAAGDMPVRVVETDGTELVVVKRTDLSLDDPKARSLAIADNRASEVGLEWDVANLQTLQPDIDLKPFFTDKELKSIFNEPGESDASESLPEGYGVIIENVSEQQQLELLDRLSAEGYSVKALTF